MLHIDDFFVYFSTRPFRSGCDFGTGGLCGQLGDNSGEDRGPDQRDCIARLRRSDGERQPTRSGRIGFRLKRILVPLSFHRRLFLLAGSARKKRNTLNP